MIDQEKDLKPLRFDHNRAWTSRAVAERYDQHRFSSIGGRAYNAMEQRCILTLLAHAQATADVKCVLEVACGTGRISTILANRGFTLTCGDISDQMLDVARARLHSLSQQQVEFTPLDINDLSRFESRYDCVCCFRLFQHLTSNERAEALKEMARASRRFVLVNVMYTSRYYGLIRSARRLLGRYTTRYTSSAKEIAKELQFAGLRQIARRFSQPGFNGNVILLLEKV